jgi:hypothetical protein
MDGSVTRGDNKLTLDNAFTPMESIKLQVEQSTHLNTLVLVWSWLRDRHKYVVVLPVVKTNVTSIH